MKPYFMLLGVLVIAVLMYTLYGMFTFQPDEPRRFVFNEPTVPPEIILRDEEIAGNLGGKLSPEAIQAAQQAVLLYKEYQKMAPQQVQDTLELLIDRMTNSGLPLYFLSATSPQKNNMRSFETLRMPMDNVIDPTKGAKSMNCTSTMPVASVVFGTSAKDTITCDATRDTMGTGTDADFVFIGGPENDQIIDSVGNRIVNGGTGDDLIQLGSGRTIVVLDASWGKDKLTLDCVSAAVMPSEIPAGFAIPWLHKTANFIVLGKSINPSDVYWNGNVLTHKTSGDTLTVNQNCFTVVPAIQ